MAKQVPEVIFLKADVATQKMTPATVRTLAYSVKFPDGESLYDKWGFIIKDGAVPRIEDIVVVDGINKYTWRTINYSNKLIMLNGRFHPSKSNTGSTRNIFSIKLPEEKLDGMNLKTPIINITPGNSSTYYELGMVYVITSYIENGHLNIVVDSTSAVSNSVTLIEEDFSVSVIVYND